MIKTCVLDGFFFGAHSEQDKYKCALMAPSADIGARCIRFSDAAKGEASGPGYQAGGNILTGAKFNYTESGIEIDFDDVTFTGTIEASGYVIYNASNGFALMSGSFGKTVRCENGRLLVPMDKPIRVKR